MTPKISLADILTTENRLFVNKNVVKPNYSLNSIDDILHRDDEIRAYYECLKDIFSGVSPSNVFIYGKPGLGKTAITRLIFDEVTREAEVRGIELCIININCDETRSEHAILQKMIQGIPLPKGEKRKVLGNSVSKHNDYFKELVNSYSGIIIIIFDELDKAARPEMINGVIRTQSEKSGQFPTVIGITNDLELKDRFPPHLLSTLCENGLIIKPYNSSQLIDILQARANIAFKPNVVSYEVVDLCAVYAAQDYGDVRRAIDILRVAGELAEHNEHKTIEPNDVIVAYEKLELDKVVEVVKTLPPQSKIALLSCILVDDSTQENDTNNIYNVYCTICEFLEMNKLTSRRIHDILSELDQLGVIKGINFFKGRYGRKKMITSIASKEKAKDVIYVEYPELRGRKFDGISKQYKW